MEAILASTAEKRDERLYSLVENPRLMSQYTKGQTWGALKKAWRGYKVGKVQKNVADMKKYAERIRTLQKELGVEMAKFPELGLM